MTRIGNKKIKIDWLSERDPKIDKIDSEYVKNVKFIKDESHLEREIGEIDFLKLPRKEFVEIFKYLDLNDKDNCRFKCNHDNDGDDSYVYYVGCFDMVDEMADFEEYIYNYLHMSERKLFGLFKDFVTKIDSKDKYKKFVEVLNSTCRLTYMDFDGYEYNYYEDNPHTKQSDIDHNYIGGFEFVVMKPIPVKYIRSIKKEVERLNALQKEDQILEK